MMFIAIIAIAIWMSLVSIYNVLIVNDQDLRQEIGLLKSIGMTRRELKRMLLCELGYVGIAGSLMGMILGGVISAIVLQLVLSSLNAAFQLSMVLQPWVLLLAFVAGNGVDGWLRFLCLSSLSLFQTNRGSQRECGSVRCPL